MGKIPTGKDKTHPEVTERDSPDEGKSDLKPHHPFLGRMRMITSQPTISIPSGGAGSLENSTEPSAASNILPVDSSMKW